jgi:hypothetical protein
MRFKHALLAAFGVVVVAMLLLVHAQRAQAAECTPIAPYIEHCRSGISSVSFNKAADTQHTPVWCWAASTEMIFAYKDHRVDQADIVKQVFGEVIPSTASDADIDTMLTGTYTDDSGDEFTVSYDEINPYNGLYDIVDALDNDDPLLITTSHHAMVLTGIEYNRNVITGVGVTTLAIVRDPWPYQMVWQGFNFTPGRRAMTPQEFADIRHIYHLSFDD